MANDFVVAALGTKLSFLWGNPDLSVNSNADIVTGEWMHDAAATTTAEFSGTATTGTVTGQWQVAAIGADPQPANRPDKLYVAVADSAGKVAVATNSDPGAVLTTAWTQWKVPLSSLTGVNLAKVKKMYIGVGDRKNPVADGAGRIYIDNIRVIKP